MDEVMYSGLKPDQWVKLVSSGVYGIFDESKKEVFVSCSNNLIKGIATVVTRLVEKDHICSNMEDPEVRVLYIGQEPKLEGSKIINRLTKEGYKVLNKVVPVVLSPKVRTLPLNEQLLAVVTLRNARGEERIIGAFDNMSDALVWMNNHYPDGIVDSIVSHSSQLTEDVKKEYEA